MRRWLFSLVALMTTGFAVCASSQTITNVSSQEPQPYTRIANPDTNTVQLQMSVRKFVPASSTGAVVWLVGASHIGDEAYYRALQKHLDAQTVVLFEGVDSEAHPRRAGKPASAATTTNRPARAPSGTNEVYSMQSKLAESLGLVFQLEAIDYDRTNFFNSDLSILEIQRLMIGDSNAVAAEPGEPGSTSTSLTSLLQIMDGSSFIGGIVKLGLQFIGSSPKLQAMTRLMLVETLGGLKGDLSEMRGLPPDMKELLKVLIEARNKKVLDDLRTELKTVPLTGSIAVFYGAGHMDDMEKRVVRELKYKPDGENWFTVFSVDMRETGLSPGEVQMIRNVVKWQLEQMQR